MKLRIFLLSIGLSLFAPFTSAQNLWVDWSTGATQPFANSTGGTGIVTYTDTFQSVAADSRNSPSNNFPFTNPINYLAAYQTGNASIDFTFSGVSPDSQSIFTLGNLRPGNRFLVSAFDANNNPVSLLIWTNYGDYLLYATDDAPNLWNPSTGEVVGNGIGQNNSQNLFLGLSSNIARIHVDFDDVDQGYEFLDFGIAGGSSEVPEPGSLALLGTSLVGMYIARNRSRRLS
jgi:hypothetical protein